MNDTLTVPERRAFKSPALEVDTEGKLTFLRGMACPYNVPTDIGWYTEILKPKLFAKSIRENAKALPLLLFHNSASLDSIIGAADEWEEKPDGLYGSWRLGTTKHAQRAAAMARDGFLSFMSVGFVPIEARTERKWDDQDELTVVRHEARLVETSLTPTPAYKEAQVELVRTAERRVFPHLANWRHELESLTR